MLKFMPNCWRPAPNSSMGSWESPPLLPSAASAYRRLPLLRKTQPRKSPTCWLTNALLAQGGNVLLFRERELYSMTALVNRYTKAPVRFIVGLSLLIRAVADPYFNLPGRLLEALARLLAQNVRVYAYPMTATDLQQAVKLFSGVNLEWNETEGWVSSEQLHFTPPLQHLYAYLLASRFLVPISVPQASLGQANNSAPERLGERAAGEASRA